MKNLILTCLIFSSISLIAQNNSFTINGTLTNDYDGYIYLTYGYITDSSAIINRKFTFNGTVDYPIESRLHIKNGGSDRQLYLENEIMDINVTISGTDTKTNSITGNKSATILNDFMEYFQSIESDPEFESKLYNKLNSIFISNPKNQMFGELLSDIAIDPILSPEQVKNLLSILDHNYQKKEALESIKISLVKSDKYKIGSQLSSIELPDINGEVQLISDIKSKIILVEFWASWCGPCREITPKLKAIYKNYNGLGFEIYGISIDVNKDNWVKAIDDDNLNWVNTIAKEGWNHLLIKELGIQCIPSNFLINADGKILAININPELLERKLSELLQ